MTMMHNETIGPLTVTMKVDGYPQRLTMSITGDIESMTTRQTTHGQSVSPCGYAFELLARLRRIDEQRQAELLDRVVDTQTRLDDMPPMPDDIAADIDDDLTPLLGSSD